MSDHFRVKAVDWDANLMRQQLSSAIGNSIKKYVTLDDSMEAMDFGAGTGLLTAHVTPHVKSIAAVDTSMSMLNKLSEKPEFHGKVTAVCQDITKKPLDRQFDLIISAMAMHHVQDLVGLFRSFAKHLRVGGKIALADLDEEDGTFHPVDTEGVYHHGFNRDELKAILTRSGFFNIHFYTAHTIDKEGKSYPVFMVTGEKR